MVTARLFLVLQCSWCVLQRKASSEKRMGGPSDAGIPASTPRNRPALLEGEHYPTRTKSSETAEITGKLGKKYNRFGMRELARGGAGEGIDEEGTKGPKAEGSGVVAPFTASQEASDPLSLFEHRQDIPRWILEPRDRRPVPARNPARVRFQVGLVIDFKSHAALAEFTHSFFYAVYGKI